MWTFVRQTSYIDTVTRRAYNIEPNMRWECYPASRHVHTQAIDVRGYADFAPLGHSVRVKRGEGVIAWRIKFRNGKKDMDLLAPITTKPWEGIPELRDEKPPTDEQRDSQLLFNEPKYIRDDGDIHTLESNGPRMKKGCTTDEPKPSSKKISTFWSAARAWVAPSSRSALLGAGKKIVIAEKANIDRSGAVAQGLAAINCYMGTRFGENNPKTTCVMPAST